MIGFWPHTGSRSHLSQDVLTRMVDQETLPIPESVAARHLSRCAQCRANYDSVARVAASVLEYRRNVIARLEPSPARRELFIRELDVALQSGPAKSWWKHPFLQWKISQFSSSRAAFASALVMIFAGVILFLLWRGQLPAVSAAELLDRAVSSDAHPIVGSNSGLIRRRFRIKTNRNTIEHSTYRDNSGHRQPRYKRTSAEEVQLAALLALAGVDWDDPLSAVSFKAWHDRQQFSKDSVQSQSDGLLTIHTLVASSNVSAESLTVRKSNFHPIKRVIEYRDLGSVSISEVSLDLLTSGEASQLFLDPKPGHPAPARPVHPAPAPLPTPAQMDEIELQARLILNENNADTGEQIDVRQNKDQVQVTGLVETEERKNALNDSLRDTPFVLATIKSFDDFKSAPAADAGATSVPQHSVEAKVSPLERYFVQHKRNRDDLSRISAGLFDTSLSINRSSRSLEQIASRFSDRADLTSAAIRARDELLRRLSERLLDDLNQQQHLLDEAGIAIELTDISSDSVQEDHPKFVPLAQQNMAATKELISGDSESSQSEQRIAAELANTISLLRATALAFTQRLSNQP